MNTTLMASFQPALFVFDYHRSSELARGEVVCPEPTVTDGARGSEQETGIEVTHTSGRNYR